jgi:hypothetical protein
MLQQIFRAAVTIIAEIISEEPSTLPYYSPRNTPKMQTPLEEIVIEGKEQHIPPAKRRWSFFEGTHYAKAPHSPT